MTTVLRFARVGLVAVAAAVVVFAVMALLGTMSPLRGSNGAGNCAPSDPDGASTSLGVILPATSLPFVITEVSLVEADNLTLVGATFLALGEGETAVGVGSGFPPVDPQYPHWQRQVGALGQTVPSDAPSEVILGLSTIDDDHSGSFSGVRIDYTVFGIPFSETARLLVHVTR